MADLAKNIGGATDLAKNFEVALVSNETMRHTNVSSIKENAKQCLKRHWLRNQI